MHVSKYSGVWTCSFVRVGNRDGCVLLFESSCFHREGAARLINESTHTPWAKKDTHTHTQAKSALDHSKLDFFTNNATSYSMHVCTNMQIHTHSHIHTVNVYSNTHMHTTVVKIGNCWIADQMHFLWRSDCCFHSGSTFPWYHTGRNPVQYDYDGWRLFGSQAKSSCPTSNLEYDYAWLIKLNT